MSDLTDILGESRKKLLDVLKCQGEVTVRQAADSLELATTTVRQHFGRLEEEGLVDRRTVAEGRGRPAVYFRMTSKARRMYPSRDAAMLPELLDFLSREGYHRAIDEFFRRYWRRRQAMIDDRLEEAGAETLEERLDVLRNFLDEQGFMPEFDVDADGAVEIRECNCPLRGAVESTRLPCRLESQFLESIVGQSPSRVEYIPDGHSACVYRFAAPGTGD